MHFPKSILGTPLLNGKPEVRTFLLTAAALVSLRYIQAEMLANNFTHLLNKYAPSVPVLGLWKQNR